MFLQQLMILQRFSGSFRRQNISYSFLRCILIWKPALMLCHVSSLMRNGTPIAKMFSAAQIMSHRMACGEYSTRMSIVM